MTFHGRRGVVRVAHVETRSAFALAFLGEPSCLPLDRSSYRGEGCSGGTSNGCQREDVRGTLLALVLARRARREVLA